MAQPGKSIFISYAREDSETADRLYDDLRAAGLEPWLDRKALLPGQRWKVEVTKAIRTCSYFLALLSSRSVSKRGYVQKELAEALELLDQIPESEPFIIPARLDECRPSHEKLHDIQWVDLFPSYTNGPANIFRVFQVNVQFETIAEPLAALDQIFTFHENGGQLSRLKVEKAITSLPRGSHVLMVAGHPPRSRKFRNLIAQQAFGRSTWKAKAWRIVPLSNFHIFANFYPHVSFFRFAIEER